MDKSSSKSNLETISYSGIIDTFQDTSGRVSGQEKSSYDRRNLKEEAIAFYTKHNVTEVLENLLNTMFLDSPQDIYGYMSEFFHSLSKEPVISSITCDELFDNNGDISLSLTLHCIINGINKPVCSYVHTVTKETQIQQDHETDLNAKASPLDSLGPLESVDKISKKLVNVCLKNQKRINAFIAEDEGHLFHSSSQSAVSRMCSLALSKLSEQPLFLSLNKSFETNDNFMTSFSVPSPLVAVLVGGISKLKIRGFYLVPSPLIPLSTGIQHVVSVYRELGRLLSTKQGPAVTSSNGAYYYTSDKPEVIMELLRDACVSVGTELNKEIMVIIDIGGEETFDEDKKKYELAVGQWKTSDEMINILSNLATGFPGLLGFVDPFHPKDISSWSILKEQVSSTSLLIADRTFSDQCLKEAFDTESDIAGSDAFSISCGALCFCHSQTLDRCFDEAARLRGFCTYLMFTSQHCHTPSSLSFDVDLAVALHCKFIKIDAPVNSTSTVVLSRLKEIKGLLESLHLQMPSSALIFPCKS